MICVSIGRGRHKHMIVEFKHLVEKGAQLVELRLDYIRGDVNLKRLLADQPAPVIITCRREEDGGKWAGDEESRIMQLRSAIAEGVDYIDLEEDVAAQIPRFGKTKRIISLHDFRHTPDDLEEIHARMVALDADIVKIATMANCTHDNVRMLRLVRNSEVPTVGMCMGEIGTPSRILAGKFGAPFTYATFHHERSLAPGQLSFQQMRDIYHYDNIRADTEVYGVIADPIGHSLSPHLHNAAFNDAQLNKVYVPFRVPRQDLETFIEDCPELGIHGLSVTIPHKESVIAHVKQIDGAVKGIGATNTILFGEDTSTAHNTDYRAAMRALDTVIGGGSDSLNGQLALVLGAGGVAKAVAFGLRRRGADVRIASRTRERSDQLAKSLDCVAIDWEDRYSVSPIVIVNGTPLGMHPNVNETPFEKHHLRPSMVVFDTVYNPEQTLLIKEARQQGCKVITGVEMFVAQAELQYRLFAGEEPPEGLMREKLKRTIGAARV